METTMWESGGGNTNTGDATIIAGPNGERKPARYIKRKGNLACDMHAEIDVQIGDLVISTEHHRGDHDLTVKQIIGFAESGPIMQTIYTYTAGQWDTQPPTGIDDAAAVCAAKAQCYHCREPHYIAN